jgi:putative transcriptional regulator
MKKKQYRSDISASIHETAEGLHKVGAIDKRTMREFDELCLTKVEPLTPDEIRDIRECENVSQVVFANYLNVTKGIISQWERGEKRPSGTSLKLLALVKKKGLSAIV